MDDIWVSDYMTRSVTSCPLDTSIDEVVAELQNNLFSCLVVVENEVPVGTVSLREMVSLFADLLDEKGWHGLRVENFMRTPANTIESDLTIMEAVTLMQQSDVRQSPVVDTTGKLVGILTQSDIIRGFYDTWLELE